MATSVREHLQNLHTNLASHHEKKMAHHAKMAEHFTKLAGHFKKTEVTEATKDAKATLEALAAEHEEMSQHHAGQVEHHNAQVEACAKAADDQMNKMVPLDRISGVTPDNPNRPGIRPVLRPGQQPIAKADVPTEFQHLFEVEEVQ